jgi:hypothetical protein
MALSSVSLTLKQKFFVNLKIVYCTTRVDMMSISHENEIWGSSVVRASNGRMRYGQSSRVVQFIFSTTSVANIK